MRGIPGPRVTVTLSKLTRTPNGFGGGSEAWADVESFTCVLQEMRGRDAMRYMKESTDKLYHLWCDATKADGTARVVTTAERINFGSRIFEIINIEDPAEQAYFYRIALREVV